MHQNGNVLLFLNMSKKNSFEKKIKFDNYLSSLGVTSLHFSYLLVFAYVHLEFQQT